MKETTRNFVVGIVAILGVAGFAFLLLLFNNFNTSLQQKYLITIHANQALGLRLGSQVTLVGVPIGEVKSVNVVIDSEHPAQIVLSIEGAIDVPAEVNASVKSSLIGGNSRLDLSIPAGYTTGGATLPRDGNAIVIAKFEALEEQLSRVLGEKLAGLDLAMRRIDELGKDAQKWLGDEQMLADWKSAVAKANDLFDAVASTAMALKGDANAFLASAQPVFDQLSKSLAQIELLTKQAQDGKGTIGQLMSNPDLYNSLNDSAQRLKSALGEVELLMQKVRAEGLGVKF